MKFFKYSIVAASLLGASLCLADLKTDYDHSVDFSRYHTYSWISSPKAEDSLWADRIKTDVDSQLAARGWQQVPSGGDASVSAFSFAKNEQTLETFYDGLGGGWFWRGFGGGIATTTVENTPVGTLVVDVFDSQTKKLIWRGVDTKTLSQHPEKNIDKLAKVVDDMFKHFPPAPRG
jgi:Domain of unknown function (DUF4136)